VAETIIATAIPIVRTIFIVHLQATSCGLQERLVVHELVSENHDSTKEFTTSRPKRANLIRFAKGRIEPKFFDNKIALASKSTPG
jgi:hypothetical protein